MLPATVAICLKLCSLQAKQKHCSDLKKAYALTDAHELLKYDYAALCGDADFYSEFLKHSEYADSLYELYRKMLYQNKDKPE